MLIVWLSSASIDISENSSKTELYKLVKKNKQNVLFTCVQIARKYSHNLFYTLSYHCEL
jgi:hypothetical protein